MQTSKVTDPEPVLNNITTSLVIVFFFFIYLLIESDLQMIFFLSPMTRNWPEEMLTKAYLILDLVLVFRFLF